MLHPFQNTFMSYQFQEDYLYKFGQYISIHTKTCMSYAYICKSGIVFVKGALLSELLKKHLKMYYFVICMITQYS